MGSVRGWSAEKCGAIWPVFAVVAGALVAGCTGEIGGLSRADGSRGEEGRTQPGAGGTATGSTASGGRSGVGPGPAGDGGGAGGGEGQTGPNPVSFACNASATFSTPAMRRLTKRQYTNTL